MGAEILLNVKFIGLLSLSTSSPQLRVIISMLFASFLKS